MLNFNGPQHKAIFHEHFMMWVFLCFAFNGFALVTAQSVNHQYQLPIDTEEIKKVIVILDSYIDLEINTSSKSSIEIDETRGGEYYNARTLQTEFKGNKIFITDPVLPAYTIPNDKLAAHKVMDSKVELRIPEGLDLVIECQNASIKIEGSYSNLSINQQGGTCNLSRISSDIKFESISAVVHYRLSQHRIEIQDRNSKRVINNGSSSKIHTSRLESISGTIQPL
ncbi:MAG: hypothetical protein WBA16_08780 [Nonlabens sp.]